MSTLPPAQSPMARPSFEAMDSSLCGKGGSFLLAAFTLGVKICW